MDISTTSPMTVLHTATTGRIGSLAAYLSVQDRGSTAVRVSMATSITVSIRTMVTMALCPDVVHTHSIISRRMRPVTAVAMWLQHRATMAPENTRCPVSVGAVVSADREKQLNWVAGTTRSIENLCPSTTSLKYGIGN